MEVIEKIKVTGDMESVGSEEDIQVVIRNAAKESAAVEIEAAGEETEETAIIEERKPKHLAWHETMEIHELVAFQAHGLVKLKRSVGKVKEKRLRSLYVHSIKVLEKNLKELLRFYSLAPRDEQSESELRNTGTGFYAGDLLTLWKTCIKNYANAVSEAATPVVRQTFQNHLEKAIQDHGKVFTYMYEKGLYPAYDLEKLLKNDIKNANAALEMDFE